MNLLNLIMNTKIIKDNPPILLDVGASGKIHYKWIEIVKYSICIAFDPDARDVEEIQNNQAFKETFFIDSLVSYENKKNESFYLTQSPYCSSMLKPLQAEVDKYSYGYLFEVERTVKVNATTLEETLKKLNIEKVDWIKTDSQGIDLKIFKSLPQWEKVIAVEFEPGFIDAYEDEDKISHVLSFMEKQDFWMSEFLVEGDVRIGKSVKEKYFSEYKEKRLTSIMKTNPGWAGITYMNDFSNLSDERDYLLGIAFNYIDNNLGYCFELCDIALNRFQNNVFKEIMNILLKEKDKLTNKKSIIVNPMEFNKSLSKVLESIQYLSTLDEKFVLYGAGTGAELIMKYIPNSIEYIVDINYDKVKNKFENINIFPLDKLEVEKKQILISVFGRETEIKQTLIDNYGVDENQIVSIW